MKTQITNKLGLVFFVLVLMFLAAQATVFIFADTSFTPKKNNVLVLPLYGVITIDEAGGSSFDSSKIRVDEVIRELREAEKDESVKAVVLEINSPGGSAVASAELAAAVKGLNKTIYAIIRDVGASGAYWVASSTDKIIASPMSITGSVGVISSYLEFSDFFEKYGVEYQRLVAGSRKDLGTPYKDLNQEERNILEAKLNKIHEIFLEEVTTNRKLSRTQVETIKTGEFFLGIEAKKLGLVDELGTKEQALKLIKRELNLEDMHIIEKKRKQSFLDLLIQQVSFSFGQGFAAQLLEKDYENKVKIEAR